ncbi:unnamed protein product [Arctogadus glacialis]
MAVRLQTEQLCSASANGYLAGVKECLQNGAEVNGYNAHGRTPLQVVKLGCPAVALYLLESGADPNRPDRVHRLTVLHDAARDGYLDMVQVLVRHGADANLVDDRGNRPVHLAVQEGHTEVVRLLNSLQTSAWRTTKATVLDLAQEGATTATSIVTNQDPK